MNLESLKPWNWFKHETNSDNSQQVIPVLRKDAGSLPTMSRTDSLSELHRAMDQLFENAFRGFGLPAIRSGLSRPLSSNNAVNGFYSPDLDVSGNDDQYEIKLDVPGLSIDDLTIEVTDDVLTIKGFKEEKNENKDRHYYRVERSMGSFQRTLSLPDDVNVDDIKAKLHDGVLLLELPRIKNEKKEVKRISITH